MEIQQVDLFSFGVQAKEAVLNYTIEGLAPIIDSHNILGAILGESADGSVCVELNNTPLRQLMNYSINDFKQVGLTHDEAIKLHASFLLTKKVIAEIPDKTKGITSPEDLYDYMKYLEYDNQEKLVAIFLDTKNHVIKRQTIFVGSLNSSLVHPREIFREALKMSAASIAIAHNHPSGDPSPSAEDLNVTKRLIECGKMIGIELLDHLIIGQDEFISLKERGYV